MVSRHLDLFSKQKEINFDDFIGVSLSVDFIISTGKLCSLDLLHWWDHIPSNVPFQLLTGRPCILGLLAE